MRCHRGHEMSDQHIVCEKCVYAKDELARIEYQREYLKRAVERMVTLPVTTKGNTSHVLLFGSLTHAWCGKAYKVKPALRRVYYSAEQLELICPLCRYALQDAVKRAIA